MTRAAHNTCALARPMFTNDRSVCPVIVLDGVYPDDPDAEWPPYCSPVDNSGVSFERMREPGYVERVKAVTRNIHRLREFCNRNRCRVSP